MKRILIVMLMVSGIAMAQNSVIAPVLPSAEEQAQFKLAREKDVKAGEALTVAVAKLPEAEALKKAQEAFAAARDKLPEARAKEDSYNIMLNAAYAAMAKRGLSSREWEPRVSPKGELEFHKCAIVPCGSR